MSKNELNGLKPGDIVYYDEAADMSDHTEVLLTRMANLVGLNRLHTITITLPRLCTYCKYSEWDHERYTIEYSDGHPFFNNNLEYLEWKACKHERSN